MKREKHKGITDYYEKKYGTVDVDRQGLRQNIPGDSEKSDIVHEKTFEDIEKSSSDETKEDE